MQLAPGMIVIDQLTESPARLNGFCPFKQFGVAPAADPSTASRPAAIETRVNIRSIFGILAFTEG
jgi:hypothetical protein